MSLFVFPYHNSSVSNPPFSCILFYPWPESIDMYVWHLNQILMYLWTRIKISCRFQCITQSERRMVCVNANMYECVYTATKETKHPSLHITSWFYVNKYILSFYYCTAMITIPTTLKKYTFFSERMSKDTVTWRKRTPNPRKIHGKQENDTLFCSLFVLCLLVLNKKAT